MLKIAYTSILFLVKKLTREDSSGVPQTALALSVCSECSHPFAWSESCEVTDIVLDIVWRGAVRNNSEESQCLRTLILNDPLRNVQETANQLVSSWTEPNLDSPLNSDLETQIRPVIGLTRWDKRKIVNLSVAFQNPRLKIPMLFFFSLSFVFRRGKPLFTFMVQCVFVGAVLSTFDIIFVTFFAVETVSKIGVLGFAGHKHSYTADPWNNLDFVSVVAGCIYLALQQSSGSNVAIIGFFRILRVMRPLRLLSRSDGTIFVACNTAAVIWLCGFLWNYRNDERYDS